MVSARITCNGCGGHNLYFLKRTEAEMTVRRIGPRKVVLQIPKPPLCLDCGSSSSSLQPIQEKP